MTYQDVIEYIKYYIEHKGDIYDMRYRDDYGIRREYVELNGLLDVLSHTFEIDDNDKL